MKSDSGVNQKGQWRNLESHRVMSRQTKRKDLHSSLQEYIEVRKEELHIIEHHVRLSTGEAVASWKVWNPKGRGGYSLSWTTMLEGTLSPQKVSKGLCLSSKSASLEPEVLVILPPLPDKFDLKQGLRKKKWNHPTLIYIVKQMGALAWHGVMMTLLLISHRKPRNAVTRPCLPQSLSHFSGRIPAPESDSFHILSR